MFSKLLTMLASTSSDAITTEGRFTRHDDEVPSSVMGGLNCNQYFYDVCPTNCKRRIIVIFRRRRAGLELTFKFETQSAFNNSDVFSYLFKVFVLHGCLDYFSAVKKGKVDFDSLFHFQIYVHRNRRNSDRYDAKTC